MSKRRRAVVLPKREMPSPPSAEQTEALLAAKVLHDANPVAATKLARQLRNVLQPLIVYAEQETEIVEIIGRLADLATRLEGH